MTISPAILSAARGVGRGIFMGASELATREARTEREKNGYGPWLEPLAQMAEECAAAAHVNRALKIAGQQPVSSPLGWVLWLTPAVLYLAAEKLGSEKIKGLARTAQNHFGTVCLVAFTVSQLVILYFSPTPGAVFALLFSALTLCPMNKWLSKKASDSFQNALLITLIASQLILAGGIWGCVATGVGMAVKLCWTHRLADNAEDPNRPGQLTTEKLVNICSGELKPKHFVINLDHLHWSSLPELPDVDVQQLLTLWDQIPWENYGDGVYVFEIPELRRRLADAVRSLKHTPPYFSKHLHLKIIAARLSDQAEAVQADLLRKLVTTDWESSWDFNYDLVFARLTEGEQVDAVPFRKKVLHELQADRTDLSKKECEGDFLAGFGINTLSGPSGSQSCGQDALVSNDVKKLFRLLRLEQKLLSNMEYTIPEMVFRIQSRANMTLFFRNEMKQWWETRLAQLPGFHHSMLDVSKDLTSDGLVLAMLYDLHIIQEKTPS